MAAGAAEQLGKMEEGEAVESVLPVSSPMANMPTSPVNAKNQQAGAKARGRAIEQVMCVR